MLYINNSFIHAEGCSKHSPQQMHAWIPIFRWDCISFKVECQNLMYEEQGDSCYLSFNNKHKKIFIFCKTLLDLRLRILIFLFYFLGEILCLLPRRTRMSISLPSPDYINFFLFIEHGLKLSSIESFIL